jgi:hypothetical protein
MHMTSFRKCFVHKVCKIAQQSLGKERERERERGRGRERGRKVYFTKKKKKCRGTNDNWHLTVSYIYAFCLFVSLFLSFFLSFFFRAAPIQEVQGSRPSGTMTFELI